MPPRSLGTLIFDCAIVVARAGRIWKTGLTAYYIHQLGLNYPLTSGKVGQEPSSRQFVTLAPPPETLYFSQPIFDLTYLNPQPHLSPDPSSINSDGTLIGDQFNNQLIDTGASYGEATLRPAKRLKAEGCASDVRFGTGALSGNRSMAAPESSNTTIVADNTAAASKPKRVRTGCLTCRERHLKCDEGVPDCLNCRKSSRACKRGVRLNFIDTQVKTPPITPPTQEWDVSFQDESREIASEYRGGLGRYAALVQEADTEKDDGQFDFSSSILDTPTMSHSQLPSINSLPPGGVEAYPGTIQRLPDHTRSGSTTESTYSSSTIAPPPPSSYSNPEQTLTPPTEVRGALNSTEEVLFMQVFVEEVGLWMDSMDPYKHFSRLLPFDSLGEPMLLNAFLACGARHLTLVNPAVYHEDKALHYYDTATRGLLKSLQNPYRDTVICATTAVILNVYEIMSEKALQRMNHIAGARALIKECGWNAKSVGIGAACFWLNVGMEILSCLHFNWQVAWDPDQWGVDMDFTRGKDLGREEVWTHRILYIVAKVENFRSSIPRYSEATPEAEQIRLQNRYLEWTKLKNWCDSWEANIPRTMRPMGYLYSYQTTSKSAFPEVWLIKRTTVVARMFYHTAMCLLAQTNPAMSTSTPEMHDMQLSHSHDLCGIVAHVKDRGVASVALRSLAIAGECLVSRREQEEVLSILDKIRKETGWRVGFLHKELKEKWCWVSDEEQQAQQQQQQQAFQQQQQQISNSMMQQPMQQGLPYQQQAPSTQLPAPPPPMAKQMPRQGIVNPMLRAADFSAPTHPYQNYYVAPSHQAQQNQYNHY